MARFGCGVLTTTAANITLPAMGLYNSASVVAALREVGISNTSSTACAFMISLVTTVGTKVSTPTEVKHRDNGPLSEVDAVTWSAGPTIGATLGYRQQLGAAVGAGVIWTFGGDGLQCAVGTANALAIATSDTTAQNVHAYMVWDE